MVGDPDKLIPFPSPLRTETPPPLTDPYHAAMLTEWNWFHRNLFVRFFPQIRTEGTTATTLRDLAKHGTLIYVSSDVGLLEYNYYNELLLREGLPLARFVNGLTNIPWRRGRAFWHGLWHQCRAHLPGAEEPLHPVRSGYLRALVADAQATFIRIRTSLLYDDRFWDEPTEDPLLAVIQAQRDHNRPCFLVPVQLLWDKRPDRTEKTVVDILFGDRERPGRLRKIVLFWRNYRKHAVVQIGTPLNLREFTATRDETHDETMARAVREALITILQRKRKGTTGPSLKPRPWMIEQVLESDGLQRMIYTLAHEQGKSVTELNLLARRYIREIAADVNYRYLEFGYRTLHWVFRHIYDGIHCNAESGLARLRTALERGPVALVPNHRSHVDYLLLAYLFYEHQMTCPYVAAGLNMAFWPLGHFFRRCGAFFLRRSFRNNRLYRATFGEYVKLLMREGACLEFFIEGGRSRTGKSLPPKMGMLSMVGEALTEGTAEDLQLMPVSITYDQVPDQGAYLREIAGEAKRRETGWDILRLRRQLRGRYGRIYVEFGEPVLYSASVEAIHGPAMRPKDLTKATRAPVSAHLANRLMREINRGLTVTPAAVVGAALLVHRRTAVTEQRLFEMCERLCHYLRWRMVPLAPLLERNESIAIRDAVQQLVARRVIGRRADFAPACYPLATSKRNILDYNKNTIIHNFVSLSTLCVILRTHFIAGSVQIDFPTIVADYKLCQQLFCAEFTYSIRLSVEAHITRIAEYLQGEGYLTLSADTPSRIGLDAAGAYNLRLFAVLLRNYFESYKAAFLACQQMSPEGLTERALLTEMQGYAQHLFLLGELRCAEAISQVHFGNAIRAFTKIGLLAQRGDFFVWHSTHPEVATFQAKLEQWC